MAEFGDPAQAERYRSYVSRGKQEAKSGNLEESIRLFKQALEIHPSEKLVRNIGKLEEALASLALDQGEEEEEEEENFVDVCGSGLLLYREMYDKLFQHQREGVAFLYGLYRDGRKGGVLADDMGLGKTVQVIAFLSGMFDAQLVHSVLLVVPTTLVGNWTRELARWTPGLRAKVFHGPSKAERHRNLERVQRRSGVLVTTYTMLLNNWQHLASCGGREFVWDYAVLDEAHKVKSPSCKTTKAAHAVPARNRLLLTGTPVQNNLKELWALFDFACQGSLLGSSKTFKMEYENPITQARAKDATPGEKALGFKMSENLMSIIKPYFLRRSKEDLQKKAGAGEKDRPLVAEGKNAAPEMPSLPRKNDFIVWVYLSPIQEEIYQRFISLDHIKELLMTTRSPLAELNILKKLCDHPRLLSARACGQLGLEASGPNAPDGAEDHDKNLENVPDEVLVKESGKLGFLLSLLERLRGDGHRTLVFSQSRKMLDIVARLLKSRGFRFVRIDGTVTHLSEREKRIAVFQGGADASVFLLTTQVGGIGLTLTAATRVVVFDPSWNPAVDAQAVDRAYRIGQTENVVVYRLITCGTVEEKIYRRQIFKDALIRQTTGDKKNPFRYFTMQELRELFTLEDTRSSSTQLQLQSLHATQRKTDTRLDAHIAYLHSLDIFGLSDHDLMYTREAAREDEAEDEEACRYIENRVQKAQELVQLESQLNERFLGNVQNSTEGAWLKEMELATQPRRRPPKPPENHVPEQPPPVGSANTAEVVSLVTDEEDDRGYDDEVIDISSKITSLVIEDVAEEAILRDVSNLSRSPSKSQVVEDVADEQMIQDVAHLSLSGENKGRRSDYLHAPERECGRSHGYPFLQARSFDKENCSPEPSAISRRPVAQDGDQSKMEEANELQESGKDQEASAVESPLRANSFSSQGDLESEPPANSGGPPAEAVGMPEDVQMASFQPSCEGVSGDEEPQPRREVSLEVPTIPGGMARETHEMDAAMSFQLVAPRGPEGSAVQKSGADDMILGSGGFASPLPFQADFNLVLEQSDGLQDGSAKEMSLGENSGFQLKLDSCSSAASSWAEGDGNGGDDAQASRNMGSVLADGSRSPNGSLGDSETPLSHRRKPVRRIVSDDEEEGGGFLAGGAGDELGVVAASGRLSRNYMSTPKPEKPVAELCFSPAARSGKRRSIASRRSLASLVVDEVDEMAEGVEEAGGRTNLESQLTEEYSVQELLDLGEELLEEESSVDDQSSSFSSASVPGDDESSF